MHQVFEKGLDKIIEEKEFISDFNIDEERIYALEITATAKSWWQNLINLRSFFKDDDLTIKIDNFEFPKRGLKQKRLFDGEVAFNGNNLKGKKKTDLFLIKLDKGKHILTFLADQKPKIHSIRIYQLEKNEEEEINYFPKDNYPIEDGDRRQWLTIVLVNLGLKFLKIIASAKQGRSFLFFKRDDADLKLIINRKIQENQEPKSHRYWYWCGRTLKGKEKTFEKELNLPSGIHYLELWVDRSPEVKEIKIGIGEYSSLPKAKVVWQEVNLREEPETNSKILASLRKSEIVEVLEKAIQGQAPYKGKGDFCNIWHKVRFEGKEGYIYFKALEVEGEEREKVKEMIRVISQKFRVDSELMIKIAEIESHFFPYAVSSVGGKGIFQLMDDTIIQIRENLGDLKYQLENPFNAIQNIEGGIRYFKWLYEIYYKGKPQRLEKTLIGWNWRLRHTPKGKKINWSKIPEEVKEFVRKVLGKNRGKINVKSVLIIGGILALILFVLLFKGYIFEKKLIKEEFERSDLNQTEVTLSSDLDSDGKLEKLIFKEIQPEKKIFVLREVNIYLQKGKKEMFLKSLDGSLERVKIEDLNKDGKKEVIIETAPSNRALTKIFTFEDNSLKLIPILPKDPAQGFLNRHGIRIIDLEGDGIKEIFVPKDWYFTKECQGGGEIYKFYGGKLVKFLEVKESDVWCENFKG